ncbi:MAG: DUF2142 domain-containing protein, partial [Anaerolineales bacterium]
MNLPPASTRHILVLLCLAALAHGALYAVLIPPWQAPDEIAHFEYSHLFARLRRPLTPGDASPALEHEIIASLYRFRAWTLALQQPPEQPPERLADAPFFGRSRTLARFSLAYVPYALAASPFLRHDVTTQLYLMRLASVGLGMLVVVLAYKTARLVAPADPALATASALFVLLLPQHAFLMASVNDGNLAEVLASAAIYFLLMMARQGLTWPRAAACLACAWLALLTKATAYFLIPLVLVAGLALIARQVSQFDRRTLGQRAWLGLVIGVLMMGAVLSGRLVAPTLAYIQSAIGPNLNSS